MKVIVKTANKIVWEASVDEIIAKGFDAIWDNIRTSYPSDKFSIFTVEKDKNNSGIIFFELTPMRED
jgi:hypothetical protein